MSEKSAVVKLKNIPFGFFEKQLHGYFKQFGSIERIRVLRSKKGHTTGIAFVKFKDAFVADVAAEAMNGYILAENRLQCSVLKTSDLPKCVQKGGLFRRISKPLRGRVRHAEQRLSAASQKSPILHAETLLKSLRARMKKINELGIDYTYDYDTKYQEFLNTLPKKKKSLKKY